MAMKFTSTGYCMRMTLRLAVSALILTATLGCTEDDTLLRYAQPAFPEELDEPVEPNEPATEQDSPTQYPIGQLHSPLTDSVEKRLLDILALQADPQFSVFMKAGDSISYSTHSMYCFADDEVKLGDRIDLSNALSFYLDGDAAGTTPFDRASAAVLGGKTASWVNDGDPSPLLTEIDAIDPSIAVVMFGTNDSGYFEPNTAQMLRWYGEEMLFLTNTLMDEGIVPILMTIPPSTKPRIAAMVDVVNSIIRGIAQGNQIPLVDYHLAMSGAPALGLSSDGVHPNWSGSSACDLSEDGLEGGYNLRNLLTLDALDRIRRVVLDHERPVDGPLPLATGSGSAADPIHIDNLPFTRLSDTSAALDSNIDGYANCGSSADESGPEEYFQLSLSQDATVRMAVVDEAGVDVDIHLFDASGACIDRDDTLIEGTLTAGDYLLVVDTYVANGSEQAGQYLLVVSH
jgi:hypothetical protein